LAPIGKLPPKPKPATPGVQKPARSSDSGVLATAKKLGADGVVDVRDAFELHELVTRDGAVSPAEYASLQAVLQGSGFNLTQDARAVLAPLAPSLQPKQALDQVTASPGWAALTATQQSQVTAMISGPTNALSAAARDRLGDDLSNPGWARLAPQEQADLLTGLLNLGLGGASRVSAPPIPTGPAPYRITGQQDVASFEFPNGETQAATRLTIDLHGHSVDIVEPSPPPVGTAWVPSVDELARSLSALPKNVLAQTTELRVSPTENPLGPGATMSASGGGVLNVYPQPAENTDWNRHIMVATLFHESGHTVSLAKWGTDPSSPAWQTWAAAAKADATSVSSYANTNALEDFAETSVVYMASRGTPAFDEYRAIFPERWKLLDSLMSAPKA